MSRSQNVSPPSFTTRSSLPIFFPLRSSATAADRMPFRQRAEVERRRERNFRAARDLAARRAKNANSRPPDVEPNARLHQLPSADGPWRSSGRMWIGTGAGGGAGSEMRDAILHGVEDHARS